MWPLAILSCLLRLSNCRSLLATYVNAVVLAISDVD